MDELQKRQIAYKTDIGTVISGKFIKQEGWLPSYIINKENHVISRVNLIGVVVSRDTASEDNFDAITIEDGTGKIQIRDFEKEKTKILEIGDVVNIIGRIREYGGSIYIFPEIIKKVEDKEWLKVRKKELEILKKLDVYKKYDSGEQKTETKEENISLNVDNNLDIENNNLEKNLKEKIFKIIKKLDVGDGAEIDEIIKNCKDGEGERIILEMLKNGDIFEIKPGKVKILE